MLSKLYKIVINKTKNLYLLNYQLEKSQSLHEIFKIDT